MKVLIELSSWQASKQASERPSEAKQARTKLIYNTRYYHARVVTTRSTVKRTWRSMRMNAMLPLKVKPRSQSNYARTELAIKC